jgi:ribosomal protein S18 acetylase RimI-like enzyme
LIRPATEHDTAAVLELWKGARSPIAALGDNEASVRTVLDHDPGSLLVAERDGRVVGTLVAAWDGWRGSMYRLAVAEDQRRQGIARELVQAGEEHLRRRGARRIGALVDRDDPAATALWAGAGYDLDEQVARYVRNV